MINNDILKRSLINCSRSYVNELVEKIPVVVTSATVDRLYLLVMIYARCEMRKHAEFIAYLRNRSERL